VLHLHCYDYDRFSRDDSIGEIHLPLCQVKIIITILFIKKATQHVSSRGAYLGQECLPPTPHIYSSLDINIFFFIFFSSYILISIYLRTFLRRKKKYVSHKIWKIGPWRSLRNLRIFSAKVDFCRFMYCFGRFSVLTQNLSTLPHCNVHNILWNALLLLFHIKQVGTPTLPTVISLKSRGSRRATLVLNLFLHETMLAFNFQISFLRTN
jgi:hypothetical protein